ncbi:MAG: hypothetical protein BGP16_06905 [Sphingobium sp. 66-54]|nr:MAG: hypothetical protein BGP16_06905 [Sphingobium sp. 66-54]
MRLYLALAGALVLGAATLGTGAVQAHHSMAMFDQQKKVSLTGTVREFQWTNPHCYIQLMVMDANGKATEWSMEMGAPMYLYAHGWRPSTLKAGQTIKISIYPLRNGGAGGVVIDATTPDGKPLGKKLS